MDTLRALNLFVRIVELGSFTGAAREQGLSQPALSKAVAGLERSLGVRLLARTTTSLSLTEEGRRFYTRCRQIVEDYQDATTDVRGQTRELTGALRVNAPLGLGELHFNDLALAFLDAHPNMQLELILNDRMIDLVEEGVDVAVRLGHPLPPDAVAREIAFSPRLLVAAPAYLQKAPKLEAPNDLSAHDYFWFAGPRPGNVLEFSRHGETVKVTASGRFRVNSSFVLRQALLQGAGLGSAPAWLVQDLVEAGALIRLLPDWTLPGQTLHLVFPSRRWLPLRVRALLNFMADRLPALPGFVSPQTAQASTVPQPGL